MRGKKIILETEKYSNRSPYNVDQNGDSIEGGALNASYTLVDAVARVSNILGKHGFEYGKDFVWDDQEFTDDMDDAISFTVGDEKIMVLLGLKQ